LKTKLGVVVIDDDKETARKRLQQIIKVPEEQVDEFAIYGSPEDVLRQKETLEEEGIQYLIVDLDPSRELEALDLFANQIIKKS
jgi:alkanesulfonate monooxygenase SsuD/methylene tetrahydromethanopterin reductase-like flavin-dependent oxidoreductase (luciferase family)